MRTVFGILGTYVFSKWTELCLCTGYIDVYMCVVLVWGLFFGVCGGCARENDYFIFPPNKVHISIYWYAMFFREKQTHKLYTIKQN